MTLFEVDQSQTQPLVPARLAPAPFGEIPIQRGPASPSSEPTRRYRSQDPAGRMFVGVAILTGCALLAGIWGTVVTSRADAEPASHVSVSVSGAATAKVLPAQVGAIKSPAARIPVQGQIGGEGIYGVGSELSELSAGTYRTAGPSPAAFDNCYWERSRDTSGQQKSVIASGLATGPATVTIKPTDRAFKSSGCQTWTKVR